MIITIILIFIIGYLAIVFEHPLKLDKTVPALLMGVICWSLISLGHLPVLNEEGHTALLEPTLLHHIGKISEIILFLFAAMTIVEIIDLHDGFSFVTKRITTKNKTSLLWIIAILSFLFSALLDNLTTTIVMVSLIKKLLPESKTRWYYASAVIISANAGGAWSPIGDVTTTMLWIGKRVSTVPLILYLILPSVLSMLLPVFILSRYKSMRGQIPENLEQNKSQSVNSKGSQLIFILGIIALIFVPVFKTITHLPPYLGMLLSLSFLWIVSEFIHPDENIKKHNSALPKEALSRIDSSSILFFLGILLAVSSLESLGILQSAANQLNHFFPYNQEIIPSVHGTELIMILLGFGSAIIDNVPLVAASMGMYSTEDFITDSKVWHLLAFTSGTGGSMLIIGSAAGVAAMGMEKIDFMWYLKKVSWLALLGFLTGVISFFLLHPIIEKLFL